MTFIPEKDYKLSFFNEQTNVNKKVLFVSEPVAGAIVSPFREKVVTVGSGSITGERGEFLLQTGTGSNSSVSFTTRRRAQYVAGYEMEVGAGVRLPTSPSGTQSAKWGYFDESNGLGYGIDSTGSFVFVRDGGVDAKVYQPDWNLDTLDGSGSSGLTLDYSEGTIAQANFTWYGYGDIAYNFYVPDSGSNRRRKITAHRRITSGKVSLETPNQPIRIEVANGADGGNFPMFVGGRQVSVFGENSFLARSFSAHVSGVSVSASPAWVPLLTVRKKSSFGNATGENNSVQVRLKRVELLSNQDLLFEVIYSLSGSLSSEGFSQVTDVPSNESAVLVKTTGSNPSGADLIYKIDTGLIGASSQRGQTFSSTGRGRAEIFLDNGSFITLRAKALTATATVNAIVEWEEEW